MPAPADKTASRFFQRLSGEGRIGGLFDRYKRGSELCLPLYEGKMAQAFDHRAAGVVVNRGNLNRPAQPRDATAEQHADPHWLPKPQFWVPADACPWEWPLGWVIGFKEITAVFHLYGLSRDDAAYVLDTFPIVRRHDEAACGRFRTRDLILAYVKRPRRRRPHHRRSRLDDRATAGQPGLCEKKEGAAEAEPSRCSFRTKADGLVAH